MAVGAALVLFLLSTPAFAIVPNISSARVANPRFGGVANTMMYTVAVTVSGAANDTMHDAQVGYIDAASYTTCNGTTGWKYGHTQRFDTTTSRTWTLYNFVPGESYYYRVQVGSSTGMKKTRCAALTTTAAPTPTLPTNLSYLNLEYDKSGATSDTDYVLFETDDCGGTSMSTATATYYLVAVDPRAEAIVWYMDISAITGGDNGTGFRYQAAASAIDDRILMTIDKRWLYEFRFDGTIVSSHDFASSGQCDGDTGSEGPCIHHDAFKSDTTGRTYVLSTQRSTTDATGTTVGGQLRDRFALPQRRFPGPQLLVGGHELPVHDDDLRLRPDGRSGTERRHERDAPVVVRQLDVDRVLRPGVRQHRLDARELDLGRAVGDDGAARRLAQGVGPDPPRQLDDGCARLEALRGPDRQRLGHARHRLGRHGRCLVRRPARRARHRDEHDHAVRQPGRSGRSAGARDRSRPGVVDGDDQQELGGRR
jgi:hypothetical protein